MFSFSKYHNIVNIDIFSMIGCGFASAQKWISYFSYFQIFAHSSFNILEDLLTFYSLKAHFFLYHVRVSQSKV